MTILPFPDRKREVQASRANRTASPIAFRLMMLPLALALVVSLTAWFTMIDALFGPDGDDYTGRYD